MNNPEANTDSTVTDDSVPMENNSQTEEALLADIIRNSEFVNTLPEEQVPQLDAEESEEEDPEESEEADNVDDEEEVEVEEEETEDEDDSSTQDSEVYTPDDLDLESQVLVKIDGEEVAVSFSDLIKGYSTEQHLSNKGRELGDARKQMEEEYEQKVSEINNMAQASAAVLYETEQQYANEYHKIEEAIQKARDEGDTYEVNELKDKREQAQQRYWKARNRREKIVEEVQKQEEQIQVKEFNEQLEHFNKVIPDMIPDFNEETAMAIREFAIDEGIAPELLDTVVDPVLIKFVDDYRRLKQGVSKGAAKRKITSVKKAPVRKAKTRKQKEVDQKEQIRQRAFAKDASPDDQMEFLRGLAERSLSNI